MFDIVEASLDPQLITESNALDKLVNNSNSTKLRIVRVIKIVQFLQLLANPNEGCMPAYTGNPTSMR